MRTQRLHPAKAALAATATGLLLGGVSYALRGGSIVGPVAVAVGVSILLFVMLAYPETANRRLLARRKARTEARPTLRRVLAGRVAVAIAILGLGLWLRSIALVLLAVGYVAFWLALAYLAHRRRSR